MLTLPLCQTSSLLNDPQFTIGNTLPSQAITTASISGDEVHRMIRLDLSPSCTSSRIHKTIVTKTVGYYLDSFAFLAEYPYRSAVELLIESGFKPTRSVVLAYGFDEECGGKVVNAISLTCRNFPFPADILLWYHRELRRWESILSRSMARIQC
jgi:hypothetical protein